MRSSPTEGGYTSTRSWEWRPVKRPPMWKGASETWIMSPAVQGGTGVVATVGPPGGKVFLLRADMDALPIQEESGLPFASIRAGAAHCCGHDTHTAMLLAAAKLLKEREAELKGTVKLMFQPGEEILMGARAMLDDGLLQSPKVDAGMALHINSLVPPGALLVFSGPMTAASNAFQIRVHGHGSHGARPHQSIDPVNVACHIYLSLQTILAREIPADERVVLTIGSIQSGSAGNVVPETALLLGTLRTFKPEIRDQVQERIRTISSHVAQAFRAEASVEFSDRYTVPMSCDPRVASCVKEAVDEILPGRARIMTTTHTASEDFAFVTQKIPCCYVILGGAVSAHPEYGQHHPKVLFEESVLAAGAAAYAQAAHHWLEVNQ